MTIAPNLAAPRSFEEQPRVLGRRAWAVLAGAAGASGVALGLTASHGVFAASAALEAEMALILVAVSTCLQFGLGPVVGAMSDRFGVRRVVAAGASALAAGGAAAGELPAAAGAVAYAAGTGVAGACTLTPLLATVSGWFGRHRTLALGLLLTGSGAVALFLPSLLTALLVDHGVGGTWPGRAAGISGAVLMLFAMTAVAQPPTGRSAGTSDAKERLPSWRQLARAVAGDRFLRRFYLSGLVSATGGAFIPTTFLVPLALERGLTAQDGAALVSLLAVAGLVSRLVLPALLVTRWSARQVYLASHLVLAASYLAWAASAVTAASLFLFVVGFGLAFGVWTTVAPTVVADACPDRLGTVLGFLYSAPALGGPLGAVVAGLLWSASGDAAWLAVVGSSSLVLAWWVLLSPSPAPSAAQRRSARPATALSPT
ncbi:MAG TPA: MFS transporter [Nocardioidaceae bacterium]|nr:MFS transporter [Nocardioidaceae bacterium]